MAKPQRKLPKIAVLYTGGTFGMDESLRVTRLKPARLRQKILAELPQISRVARCDIDIVLNRDSAHVGPREWIDLARRIRVLMKKNLYRGIVVLHGTDTLAFTASALSFLLRPCKIPVVMTGAQLPLAALLTDARRNFLSALEVAAYGPRDLLNQVSVFFDDALFQGNRVHKRSASEFEAFEAQETLARAGSTIRYLDKKLKPIHSSPKLVDRFDTRVAHLRVTPGFPSDEIRKGLLPHLRGLVLSVFASGTVPSHDPQFKKLLHEARTREIPVIAVAESATTSSQPSRADVHPKKYEAGRVLIQEGCFWAAGMTPECAQVKAMLALGQPAVRNRKSFARVWNANLARES